MKELTQEQLKEVLHYNIDTGDFTWKIIKAGIKLGGVAGSMTCHGYTQIKLYGDHYKAHRLVWLYMTGEWPKGEIDHDDQVKNNNEWKNLFDVSQSKNKKNKPIYKNNKSGVTGVSWSKSNKKWMSCIKVNKKRIYLGYFTDKFEAVCSRLSANNKYGFHANHGRS